MARYIINIRPHHLKNARYTIQKGDTSCEKCLIAQAVKDSKLGDAWVCTLYIAQYLKDGQKKYWWPENETEYKKYVDVIDKFDIGLDDDIQFPISIALVDREPKYARDRYLQVANSSNAKSPGDA